MITRRLPYLLAILHVCLLIGIRMLYDADDFNNWDLIPFLNANTADSLWSLLQRAEVHFWHPFSFPLYNVGAESVCSAVLFRLLGHLSLYWSNVLVLIVYDLVFLSLLHRLISFLFPAPFYRCLTWLLVSMSPVVLTFASNSAFNMQGYIVILLGLCGTEYFLKKQRMWGTILLAAGFILISQGYPLGFFLPYYIAVWILWRLLNGVELPEGEEKAQRGLIWWESLHCWFIVTLSTLIVHFLSGGIYLKKISPLNPHDNGNVLGESHILSRMVLFLKQSFLPEIKVDNVPFGFAPYFVYAFLFCLISLYLTEANGRRLLGRFQENSARWRQGLALLMTGGLIAFGYLPSFMNPVVKSQRTIFGDIFLIIVVVLISKSMAFWDYFHKKKFALFMTVLIATSDCYYLSTIFSVNHAHNHSPVFDFDLSDGITRHDLISAIKAMKKQVEEKKTTLIIYYPRGYSENTTDPGMFFAHFLRHFGRFTADSRLIFPYQWCDMRYGCPFPDAAGQDCSQPTHCYSSPDANIAQALANGNRVMIWQWKDSQINQPVSFSIPNMTLQPVDWSGAGQPQEQNMVWKCYELVPTSTGSLGMRSRGGSGPSAARSMGSSSVNFLAVTITRLSKEPTALL